jgi:hypothetical protein
MSDAGYKSIQKHSGITPLVRGNIDLDARPQVKNPDGSISTVYGKTFTMDNGRAIIVPGVDNKRQLSDKEAWQQFQKTKQHLGIFKSLEEAEKYGNVLHLQQDARYPQPNVKRPELKMEKTSDRELSPTMALMKEAGEPLTRENYLNLAFLGNPPSRLHPEEEAEMPDAFQTQQRDMSKDLHAKATKMEDKHKADQQKAKERKTIDIKKEKPQAEPETMDNPNPAVGGINTQVPSGGLKGEYPTKFERWTQTGIDNDVSGNIEDRRNQPRHPSPQVTSPEGFPDTPTQ